MATYKDESGGYRDVTPVLSPEIMQETCQNSA
jgi:hypothetical protein